MTNFKFYFTAMRQARSPMADFLIGCYFNGGGSVDEVLTSKFRLPTQQFPDQIRQPSQSPEWVQDKRLCIKNNKHQVGRLLE
jgi:hypothetical protein